MTERLNDGFRCFIKCACCCNIFYESVFTEVVVKVVQIIIVLKPISVKKAIGGRKG